MDVQEILSAMRNGLALAEKLSPLAAELGGGAVANVIGALAEVGANAIDRVQEGILVANSTEQEQLQNINAAIASVNDTLAAAIAAS